MPRYVALLRGVSPLYLKMSDLQAAVQDAGFTDVRTLLSSGNVAFDTRVTREATIGRRIEQALQERVGRHFPTFVRTREELQRMIETDPYAGHRLPKAAKRVVTFLRVPHPGRLALPIVRDEATIVALAGREAFTAYVPGPRGPLFMPFLEKTFGRDQTTRTWDTVRRCAAA